MSESDQASPPLAQANIDPAAGKPKPMPAAEPAAERRRWWIKVLVQPLIFLAGGAALFAGLGVVQHMGWLSAESGGATHEHVHAERTDQQYICPMMCTPPQSEPGRCPVCAMELVPAAKSGGNLDPTSVQIDPAARRVANIHTVAAKFTPLTRTVRAIGEIRYDEGTLKSISAYVDGRLERLYADYTGVVVRKGDRLALVYSPRLYSAQVELLLARKARDESRSATLSRVTQSNQDLYESARRRLLELGMTDEQVERLEQAGEANSRMHLFAPISGTVIEKRAVEGQYLREGDTIYRLADLSTVWLMLKLFPEDAAAIRYGQKVEAEVQSLPGRTFTGRVAFVDPNVDPQTRTVGVRVVIANDDNVLRVGDYAKATLNIPWSNSESALVYDPDLAKKWISPRHPHVISDTAGDCPICGVELVPARKLGFTDEAEASGMALVVPRDAVLMAGTNSVVYVETEPGHFELRRVVLGPQSGDHMVIRSGVSEGEQVATRGNFLIDSQMQLAGNPSLIDPTKSLPNLDETPADTMLATLAELSDEDRALVAQQRICPVAEFPLGSMGVPQKVDVQGRSVFICCESCRAELLAEPGKYLAKLEARLETKSSQSATRPGGHSQLDLPPMGDLRLVEPGPSPAEVVPPVQRVATPGHEVRR